MLIVSRKLWIRGAKLIHSCDLFLFFFMWLASLCVCVIRKVNRKTSGECSGSMKSHTVLVDVISSMI